MLHSLMWPIPHRGWGMAVEQFVTHTVEYIPIMVQYSITYHLKLMGRFKINSPDPFPRYSLSMPQTPSLRALWPCLRPLSSLLFVHVPDPFPQSSMAMPQTPSLRALWPCPRPLPSELYGHASEPFLLYMARSDHTSLHVTVHTHIHTATTA